MVCVRGEAACMQEGGGRGGERGKVGSGRFGEDGRWEPEACGENGVIHGINITELRQRYALELGNAEGALTLTAGGGGGGHALGRVL